MDDESDIELPGSDIELDADLKEEVDQAIESDDEAELEVIETAEIGDVDMVEDEASEQYADEEAASEPAFRRAEDHIAVRQRVPARDSRQPDIPSIFEVTALTISRACALANNSQPLIPFVTFDPARIARAELAAGKSLRSILRGDAEWKWSDFAYFPVGFLNTHETTAQLHDIT